MLLLQSRLGKYHFGNSNVWESDGLFLTNGIYSRKVIKSENGTESLVAQKHQRGVLFVYKNKNGCKLQFNNVKSCGAQNLLRQLSAAEKPIRYEPS